MGNPPEIPSGTSDERGLARIIGEHLFDLWHTRGLRVAILYLVLLVKRGVRSRYFYIALLFGAGVGLMVAIGQSYAIGLHPAWKLYGWWWVISPLYGPAMALTFLLVISVFEEIERQAKTHIHPKFAPWLIGSCCLA